MLCGFCTETGLICKSWRRLADVALSGSEMYASCVHMTKSVSIVAARRELGRLAGEVNRTGQPVILTRRGQAVARIVPEPATEPRRRELNDPFAQLRGTVRLNCDLDELQLAVRRLRADFTTNLDRRAATLTRRRTRAGT
jgi:prevent-host-death family protein